MKNKRNILVIYTGGTIGMVQDHKTGALKPFNFEQLINKIPELKELHCNIDSYSFKKLIDSSDLTPNAWVEIASVIEKQYNKYDGFVVLHGTDTMAFSSSALSFMLDDLNKPVVFTGSQLPLGINRTDGKENVITAIEIASAEKNGNPIVPEVCLYFENCLYRGNRVHKSNAEQFEAFRSENYPILAEAGIHIKYNLPYICKINNKKLKVSKKLNTQIAILKLFPGITSEVVKAVLNTKNIKAVILETYGAGNAPTDEWFIQLIKQAIQKEIIIYNVTQCRGGAVELGRYQTSAMLEKAGVVSGFDITIESAVAKLMFLLAGTDSKDEIKRKLQTSLRGEITV